jgi:hypothetical protein
MPSWHLLDIRNIQSGQHSSPDELMPRPHGCRIRTLAIETVAIETVAIE